MNKSRICVASSGGGGDNSTHMRIGVQLCYAGKDTEPSFSLRNVRQRSVWHRKRSAVIAPVGRACRQAWQRAIIRASCQVSSGQVGDQHRRAMEIAQPIHVADVVAAVYAQPGDCGIHRLLPSEPACSWRVSRRATCAVSLASHP